MIRELAAFDLAIGRLVACQGGFLATMAEHHWRELGFVLLEIAASEKWTVSVHQLGARHPNRELVRNGTYDDSRIVGPKSRHDAGLR